MLNQLFNSFNFSAELGYAITVLSIIVCMASGYLLGSINPSIIISAKFYKDDIRRHGSGNAGMTNVMRTYGKKMAIITFAGDFLKAVIASLVGRALFGYYGAVLAGFFCFLGHIFPCYYKFKGGKGVVTACGMVLMTDPKVCLVLLVLFVAIVAITKYISLGSVVCTLVYPIILYNMKGDFVGIPVLIAFAVGLLCAFAHRTNIKRIMNGTENQFTFKVKDKKT
ncbi:MAG: glycerol-3-phosphate 1-O-acyltransferase PlsY, partial [Clostridia bacterium]|nr:glycerol-3-phosphate 1-O-acyltransferase PlsY [Clostridia bacterium]